MFSNLLIKPHPGETIEAFVDALPELIGCDRWEKRPSETFPGGCFYSCLILGFEITLSHTATDEFAGYSLRMCLEAESATTLDRSFLNVMADTVARKLALQGYDVIRPVDLLRTGSGAIVYYPNPDSKAEGLEKILTKEI